MGILSRQLPSFYLSFLSLLAHNIRLNRLEYRHILTLVPTPDLSPPFSLSFVMASVKTDSPAASENKVKPTKPDEESYKAELANAEKEHAAVQEKLVRKQPDQFAD